MWRFIIEELVIPYLIGGLVITIILWMIHGKDEPEGPEDETINMTKQ